MAFRRLLWSFYCAGRGLILTLRFEPNMRIHALAAAVVVVAGVWLGLPGRDLAILLLLIAAVMGTEALNAALERICDVLRDRYGLPYEASRDIRDIAAGAVLVQALAAVAIGLILFGGHLFRAP